MSSKKALGMAQKLFRDWCACHGATVEATAAADLVKRIALEIEATHVQAVASTLNGDL